MGRLQPRDERAPDPARKRAAHAVLRRGAHDRFVAPHGTPPRKLPCCRRLEVCHVAAASCARAVVVLTTIGDSARLYVTEEFRSLGTELLIITPGKSETSGGGPSSFLGATARDLTLEDALALERSSAVKRVAPMIVGEANMSYGGRNRQAPGIGATVELLELRHWKLKQGKFLPGGDPERAPAVIVIGDKIRKDLFGTEPAVGNFLRVGDRRFRVIGILHRRSISGDGR